MIGYYASDKKKAKKESDTQAISTNRVISQGPFIRNCNERTRKKIGILSGRLSPSGKFAKNETSRARSPAPDRYSWGVPAGYSLHSSPSVSR
jgi:hypothetical protein